MNRITMTVLAVVTLAILGGCAGTAELARTAAIATRQDVFVEKAQGQSLPPGYAELRVVSSLKTHGPEIYSRRDVHGTPEYKLLLNIGGQTAELSGDPRPERSEPLGLRDPEAGEGMRYRFTQTLYVKAGTHHMVVALPADNVATEREIILPEGSSTTIVLEPGYGTASPRRRPSSYTVTDFREGIRALRVVLNDETI
ncbi:putative lipoprotein [Geobacter metallireducens RCH3]|uniref:Lipoprotein, putative n=1 Tax=Geobacter metallireducens (strain ATCC 53774 / DSM 7210 / GS-15) TaxID=269799 RepID=Q39PV9_GEOMG|nr:hypothetical protein [Geobacter metallireducens]ABB33715.1 lipoprotein, putative [Geobacter metallireducens GS-15]EHP85815.1 putative lipoprotein [Geobacter metallireducens RCH3]